jgi:hypothetical protein
MTTLLLDKTLNLFADVIASLQLEIEEDNYYENEYLNSVENRYSHYGF